MAIARARPAVGFTLPLTMALAFSLMALATAIVGMVLVSDKQAKAAASDVVTRTSLESAIEAGLFDLEQNGEPQAAEWTGRQTVNGEDVALILADARYKPDVNHAPADQAGAVIADPALRDRTLAALTAPAPGSRRPDYQRFADFVAATGSGPAEEDCLRRRLTIGRVADMLAPPPVTALAPPRAPLPVGAVVDVRAETRDWEGRWEVLWRRARYTGRPERPWLTHDWRQLRLGRTEPVCPLVEAVATISSAPHRRP
jgi:hypothetical protein